MRVDTSIGGSRLVVFFSNDNYIDVRKDTRPDRCEVAEVVRRGHMVERVPLLPKNAAETVVGLIRSYKRGEV